MTIPFQNTRYNIRFAATQADVIMCQQLRHSCFFDGTGTDADPFDDICSHFMVEDQAGRLVATARFFVHRDADATGYTAQFYDLDKFASQSGHKLEIGRFCIVSGVLDADVLRVLWGGVVQVVDRENIVYLFGCTSFDGIDPAPYADVFSRLATRHLGPDHQRPAVKAPEVVAFAPVDQVTLGPLPPLLRSYLTMAGWVGDHAVIDRHMQTLHVFTCVEVAKIPLARVRALRALALGPLLP